MYGRNTENWNVLILKIENWKTIIIQNNNGQIDI
jgi:hypothetical protein